MSTRRIGTLVDHADRSGVGLLVLPDAALGGYLADLRHPDPDAPPPVSDTDGPLIGEVARMAQDQQSRLFDLYDCARASENRVVLASSHRTGALGGMRFLGQAEVVGPGGEVPARTGAKAAIAVAAIDPAAEIAKARRVLSHLTERTPAAYA